MNKIRIEKSLDSRNYPFKVISEDGKSCSWKLDYWNEFTIEDGLLKGHTGDFRSGGSITPRNIEDVIGWDFKGWGNNSIFLSCPNKEDVELVKQEMLDYIEKQLQEKKKHSMNRREFLKDLIGLAVSVSIPGILIENLNPKVESSGNKHNKILDVTELPQGALARYERDINAKSYIIKKRGSLELSGDIV